MNVTKDLILTPYLTLSNGTIVDVTTKLEAYGYRTMWQIIQTCVLTVLACAWITIHPNISSHRDWSSRLYFQVQIWIVGLVMPDLLLLWAAKQHMAARKLVKENGWTMRQSFFALMVGIQDEEGNILSPYFRGDLFAMPTDEEILDKSKQDFFVKLLTYSQTLWFVVLTIYRIQSPDLFATEVEIITLVFVSLSAITSLLWWSKPQRVRLRLPRYPNPTPPPNTPSQDSRDVSPNCFKFATSLLRSEVRRGYTDQKFISKVDIFAYSGTLSWNELAIAVICASTFGSLSGVCHAIIASLSGGLTTLNGRLWFVLALMGSSLPFYLLVVIFISFGLKVTKTERQTRFLYYALNGFVGRVFLFVSMIGRISLIVLLIYLMFTPYNYTAFLTPRWSQYLLHPF